MAKLWCGRTAEDYLSRFQGTVALDGSDGKLCTSAGLYAVTDIPPILEQMKKGGYELWFVPSHNDGDLFYPPHPDDEKAVRQAWKALR